MSEAEQVDAVAGRDHSIRGTGHSKQQPPNG